jgi:hypothetical protein
MKNIIIQYLVIGASICFHHLNAQDYLVTTKGDTLFGEVKPILMGIEKKVTLITPDKTKTTYSILQVRSYQLHRNEYHTVRMSSGYTFMKLLKPGYLSLYAFQGENQNTFNVLFLKKSDGATLEVPNLNFKKLMKNFLQDCAVVADSIESGAWGKRELDKIVSEYNKCISGKSPDTSIKTEQSVEQSINVTPHWDVLKEKINKMTAFENRNDVLDMIADVNGKISRGERLPDYLIKALKSALSNTDLLPDLEIALNQTNLK